MPGSILNDTKKNLGVPEEDTSFDLDITTHINSTLSILQQLGVGPDVGFMIEDESDEWDDFIAADNSYNLIRTYIFLKVRMLFDPPNTSFLLDAWKQQIEEYETRIRYNREWLLNPVDPITVNPTPEQIVISDDFWRRWTMN